MVIISTNINKTNNRLSSSLNSLNPKKNTTYDDVGNPGPGLGQPPFNFKLIYSKNRSSRFSFFYQNVEPFLNPKATEMCTLVWSVFYCYIKFCLRCEYNALISVFIKLLNYGYSLFFCLLALKQSIYDTWKLNFNLCSCLMHHLIQLQ